MNKQNKQLITDIRNTLLYWNFEGSVILSIAANESIVELILKLPTKYTEENLNHCLLNLTEVVNGVNHKITAKNGKLITIQFTKDLPTSIDYNPSFFNDESLQISVLSAYGIKQFNFLDPASCHMLIAGMPRMGKTFTLIYIATMLYTQSNINLYIVSQKGRDFYPFENKKRVEIVKDEENFYNLLDKLIDIYKERDRLLYTLPKATDAKSVKELHPSHYHLFKPIFIMIDEYADYTHRKDIQEHVAELVRKAGYLNIHVIICTQRPEARFTVPANIKMGLGVRLSLPVADSNNSIVIIDEEGAEKLPKITGRAILKDGDLTTVQIPKLTYDKCSELLQPYERNVSHETINHKETEGATPTQLDNNIQDMFTQSTLFNGLSQQQQPDKRMQQNNETSMLSWSFPSSPSVKG